MEEAYEDERQTRKASDPRMFHFKKRDAAIADKGGETVKSGDLSFEALCNTDIWKLNSNLFMGIATEKEVGLDQSRWPVMCKIISANASIPAWNAAVDTVARYWPVVDANGSAIPFALKAVFKEDRIGVIYERIANFDEMMYNSYDAVRATIQTTGYTDAENNLMKSVYEGICSAEPTVDMIAKLLMDFDKLLAVNLANRHYARIQIDTNAFMIARPHGVVPRIARSIRTTADDGTTTDVDNPEYLPPDKLVIAEAFITLSINYERMNSRNANVPTGLVNMAALSVANMFRYGFYEMAAGSEFGIAYFSKTEDGSYAARGVVVPPTADPITSIPIGYKVDMKDVKVKSDNIEIANAFVGVAAIMHYQFNHTTGSTMMTGPLAALTVSYGLLDRNVNKDSVTAATTVWYEALHPVNKRLMANILFPNCRIYTAGRHSASTRIAKIQRDTYMTIRSTPAPSGAHKAYLAAEVLKRLCSANLLPFVPWANEISTVVGAIKEIIEIGANAHTGSKYYTGNAPRTQGAVFDQKMADLACYIQSMARQDTLAMSPHLSVQKAMSANPAWAALMKSLRSSDITTADPEKIKKYLKSAGSIAFELDPNDEKTWAKAQSETENAARILRRLHF